MGQVGNLRPVGNRPLLRATLTRAPLAEPHSPDKFHDECGVVAVYGHPEAATLAYLGLYALQHRGQESAGICTSDGVKIHTRKSMGHVVLFL